MRFIHVPEMKPGTLKRFLRLPDFPLHLALHRLDCLASHGELDTYEFCREKLAELSREELHPPRLLGGNDLIRLGFVPGPIFREILEFVEEAQLSGEIASTREAQERVLERFGSARTGASEKRVPEQ
jgi:poly(A) polymerase